MTIQQCKYVLTIANTGSFNEASKQLFVAQSSLSNSIKLLENELNIKIFERSKNGVTLTPEGAEFLRYASQMVEQNDFILNRYNSKENPQKLHIATQHYDFIADIFCNFLKDVYYNEYHFSLREIKTYDVIKEVETATSDVGIIAIKDNDFDIMMRLLNNKRISFHQFLTAYPHIYVRANHPLTRKTQIKPEDLRDYPYLSYEQGSHNSSFYTEELIANKQYRKHVEISDRATLMNVLLTTNSYTVGTGIMPSALNDGKICAIPLTTESCYKIGFILCKDRTPSILTKKFLSLLNDYTNTLKKQIKLKDL
ncbi:MAG: LysR family transcriptional regulator [Clostridia bacterium]|nr:LysR family transcriptional regulator [Clostridia bacterium]